jgi:hypothetical protein
MGEGNISPSLTSGKLTSITANVVCTDWVEKTGRDYEPGSNFNYTNSWGMHTRSLYLVLNPLNAELNPICHLLALLGVHHFLHVSRIRVNNQHMLLRYGLKCVCVPLLLSENKISATVFWGTRADNFCSAKRNCSFVINIIVIIIIINNNGNKVYTILNWINQPDAAISQVYYLSFKQSSTCFGHPHCPSSGAEQLQ